ncbi:phage adaptor protein [Lelliottia wanjuensis]|uniref:phage adaptor protein n=1 Tax=Lelliottia wanjuensis TaxID=3050585 RepID=UPI00255059D3|nr:hypothetical protein [Lelliottia sp. V86_10]MDK9586726.1 hypothetical protein [Lelliottia sp. V86_10]
MSTTYSNLVTAIKAYSGRTDSQTINAIPQFIAAAQTKLDSELRIGTMSSTTEYPADSTRLDASSFITIETVLIGGLVGTLTTMADITALRKVTADRPEIAGYDFHYSMNGNSIELVKPNEVEITGYQKPLRISDANQTNAYTDGAENALLWYSLGYLGVFARDNDAAGSWSAMAESEVETLNATREQFQLTGAAKVKKNGGF